MAFSGVLASGCGCDFGQALAICIDAGRCPAVAFDVGIDAGTDAGIGVDSGHGGSTHDAGYATCKDVYDAYAASGKTPDDGLFDLRPGGSEFVHAYCDMANGGWTLIAAGGRAVGGIGDAGCATFGEVTTVSLDDSCGYLSKSVVRGIASRSRVVRLRAGEGHQRYTSVSSTDTKAIDALADGGNWHNDAGWTSDDRWCWDLMPGCPPTSATGWPNMFHACGTHCVHWLVNEGCKTYFTTACGDPVERSSTWLK